MSVPNQSRARRGLLIIAAMAFAALSSANTTSNNFTIDFSRTDWNNGTIKTGSLHRFDSSLGTLTSVTLTLDDTLTSNVKLGNLSHSSSAVITGNLSGLLTLKDVSVGAQLPNVSGTASKSVTSGSLLANPTPGFSDTDDAIFTSTSGQIFSNVTASGSFFQSSSAPSLLAYVTGGQDLSFTVTATDLSRTTGPNNIRGVYETLASAKGTITYTYSPVPEPASIAALGVGALGLIRRRKASKGGVR